ncbi:32827_t:CDS:2 [Gigaspora margarita]|uniref:32827_t:CDS:1 n=1 Tax=Gigaspora margarita TaxID=4874 RepID=A0ABN7VSH8_GIGMA|nr:32827_t:CDS:2 [Gigaspora margarita]
MLGCLVIGEDNGFTVKIDKIKTISQLRETIKNNKKRNAFAKIDANELTLFKVNFPEDRKYFGSEKLVNDFDTIEEHFGIKLTEKHIYVIIKKPINIGKSGSSRQSYVKGVPPEPNAVFENFLNCEHGQFQFLRSYITNNDALPLYESKISLKTDVPATSSNERPLLLLYNLPGGSIQKHKPVIQISDVQSAIAKAKNNLLVMLETSGCGKMKTCYELLCENWGLYFVASRKGNGGSGDIEAIENYLGEKITDDLKMNRKHAEHITRCAILSRLLILNHCINLLFNPSIFNAQRWLLLQICQKNFGKLYNYTDDIFLILMMLLTDCTSSSVKKYIDTTYKKILKVKKINVFLIILDEMQALEMILKEKFKSQRNEEKHSLLSPIIQSLREPALLIVNHCVIPCGTGLGIFSLDEILITRIAKPETGIDKFTEFGEW